MTLFVRKILIVALILVWIFPACSSEEEEDPITLKINCNGQNFIGHYIADGSSITGISGVLSSGSTYVFESELIVEKLLEISVTINDDNTDIAASLYIYIYNDDVQLERHPFEDIAYTNTTRTKTVTYTVNADGTTEEPTE